MKNEKEIGLLLERKATRRQALKNMGLGALGVAALGATRARATNPIDYLPPYDFTDAYAAQLALNLEYLEANFYSYATTGVGIQEHGVTISGGGATGTVTVPSNPQVTFVSSTIKAYAEEITADEIAHVNFLRQAYIDSGRVPPAQPNINLVSSFADAAAAAGITNPSPFSPFASNGTNDLYFLLGSFIFEDVGVTAYHGAVPNLGQKDFRNAAAGIMATEAYHASLIRTELYKLGASAIQASQAISDARNALGGEGLDQGIETNGTSSIVPSDGNALVFARTARLVLNIVYLGINASKGGFFPDGINTISPAA